MTHTDPTVKLVANAIEEAPWPCAHSNPGSTDPGALVERGHGLAPVIAHQWSVRHDDGFVHGGNFTEAGARQRAAELGGEVVYRAVGPWQPAERAVTGEKRADQQAPTPDPSGCPEIQWDGPYRFRCGLGGSTGVCGRHGRFRFPYENENEKPTP